VAAFTPEQIIEMRSSAYGADDRVADLVTLAGENTGLYAYGNQRNQAIALLVLHWLTRNDKDGIGNSSPGALQMEREGSLQRQWLVDFSLTKAQPDQSQTAWGMELLGLRKSCVFGPRTRMTTAD
jgi:hypothetical protein